MKKIFTLCALLTLIVTSTVVHSTSSEEMINDFGLRTLVQLNNNPAFSQKNILISPLSLHMALSMAAEGTQDKTREEFSAALGDKSFFSTTFYSPLKTTPNEFNIQSSDQ